MAKDIKNVWQTAERKALSIEASFHNLQLYFHLKITCIPNQLRY